MESGFFAESDPERTAGSSEATLRSAISHQRGQASRGSLIGDIPHFWREGRRAILPLQPPRLPKGLGNLPNREGARQLPWLDSRCLSRSPCPLNWRLPRQRPELAYPRDQGCLARTGRGCLTREVLCLGGCRFKLSFANLRKTSEKKELKREKRANTLE